VESAKWGLDSEDVFFGLAAPPKSPKPRLWDSTQIPNLSSGRAVKNLFPPAPDYSAIAHFAEGNACRQILGNPHKNLIAASLAIQSSACHVGDTKASIRKNLARLPYKEKGSLGSPISLAVAALKRRRGGTKSDAERLDPVVEAADLAGGQVGMDDTLGRGAVDFRLGSLEGFHGDLVIAGHDGFLDLADEGAHARTTRLVDRGAGFDLAGSLLG